METSGSMHQVPRSCMSSLSLSLVAFTFSFYCFLSSNICLPQMERKAYEVLVEDGKLLYKQTGELLNTDDLDGAKWIFVLSTSKALYVGKKTKGKFQHSSFLAGGATLAAGRIVVQDGILKVNRIGICLFNSSIVFAVTPVSQL